MEGAVEAGERAADAVIAELRQISMDSEDSPRRVTFGR